MFAIKLPLDELMSPQGYSTMVIYFIIRHEHVFQRLFDLSQDTFTVSSSPELILLYFPVLV